MNALPRRRFLKATGLAAAWVAAGALPALAKPSRDASKPNIIYILADDLGYSELGCYGQKKILTPHIDKLAAEGMKFSQHYSGSPVCAPSRCVLMTGLHTGHSFIRDNREVRPEGQYPIPADTFTVAKMLKKAGYATCAIGKWGLGPVGSTGDPNKQGFDHFFGYNCQRHAHSYYPTYLWRNDKRVALKNPPFRAHQKFTGDVSDPKAFDKYKGPDYAPDRMADEALRFIRENTDGPFFLYYPTPVPHVSLQAPDDSVNAYQGKWPETPYLGQKAYLPHATPRAAYAAMISRMDRDVGRMMALLKTLGLDDNTLVIFSSDNGPTFNGGSDSAFFNSAGPLKGLKCSLWEGGIRVPMIARWPGRIKPGSASDHLSAFWDVMPTLADVVGTAVPKGIDGISFAPTLLGKGPQKAHEYLYWERPGSNGQAVRMGKFKALRLGVRTKARAPVQLYDLDSEIGEATDVADKHPAVVARIEKIMADARTPSALFPLLPSDIPPDGSAKDFAVLHNCTVRKSPTMKYRISSADVGLAVMALPKPRTGKVSFNATFQVVRGSGWFNGGLVFGDGAKPEDLVRISMQNGSGQLFVIDGEQKTVVRTARDGFRKTTLRVTFDTKTNVVTATDGTKTARVTLDRKIARVTHVGYDVDHARTDFGPIEMTARAAAPVATGPVVLPTPLAMTVGEGQFTLDKATAIVADAKLVPVAKLLAERLRPATQLPLPVRAGKPSDGGGGIVLTLARLGDFGAEGYGLSVTPKGVTIRANTPEGAFRATATLRQLLPPEIESDKPVAGKAWSIPCVTIGDEPRFAWRGLMLDSGRQYQSVAFIKRYIDLLAALKMNVFHWHLTENDGWRIEVKKYPRLTSVGSKVAAGPEQHGFYTQDEIREIVAYAAARFVTVVPEIDIPGHSLAALKSYPELTCKGKMPKVAAGHSPYLYCAGRPETYTFLENVLAEVCELFPSTFIHIGGDEAPKREWDACPRCQAAIKTHKLKNSHELQIHFTNRIAEFLASKGRRAICWGDVVTHPGGALRKDLVIQWWNFRRHKTKGLTAGVQGGHDVICSPNYYTYLNFPVSPWSKYAASRTFDLRTAYEGNDFAPKSLTAAQRKHILGVQACLWTDHHVKQAMIDERVFPRIFALTEHMWHKGKLAPFDEFYRRLQSLYPRLKAMGITYGPAMKDDEIGEQPPATKRRRRRR